MLPRLNLIMEAIEGNDSTTREFTYPPSESRSILIAGLSRRNAAQIPTVSVNGSSVSSLVTRVSSNSLNFTASVYHVPISEGDSFVFAREIRGGISWARWFVYEADGLGAVQSVAQSDNSATDIDVTEGGLVFGTNTNPEGENNFERDGVWTYLQNQTRRLSNTFNDSISTAYRIPSTTGTVSVGRSSARAEFSATAVVSFFPALAAPEIADSRLIANRFIASGFIAGGLTA